MRFLKLLDCNLGWSDLDFLLGLIDNVGELVSLELGICGFLILKKLDLVQLGISLSLIQFNATEFCLNLLVLIAFRIQWNWGGCIFRVSYLFELVIGWLSLPGFLAFAIIGNKNLHPLLFRMQFWSLFFIYIIWIIVQKFASYDSWSFFFFFSLFLFFFLGIIGFPTFYCSLMVMVFQLCYYSDLEITNCSSLYVI